MMASYACRRLALVAALLAGPAAAKEHLEAKCAKHGGTLVNGKCRVQVQLPAAVQKAETEYTQLLQGESRGGDPVPLPDGDFPKFDSDDGSGASFDAICEGRQLRDHAALLRRKAADGEAKLPKKVIHVKGPRNSDGVSDFFTQSHYGTAMAVRHKYGLYIEWQGLDVLDAVVPAPGGGFNWSDSRLLDRCAGSKGKCTVLDPLQTMIQHWSQGGKVAWDKRRKENDAAVAAKEFYALLPIRRSHGGDFSEVAMSYPMKTQYVGACVLGSLFAPSPKLAEAVPEFPVLQKQITDPRTLAIAIYIRTYDSEDAQALDNKQLDSRKMPPRQNWTVGERYNYAATARCALQLEARHAAGFDRVVWFVASDRPTLKQQFVDEFDASATGGRAVLTTAARGRHTSPSYWANNHRLSSELKEQKKEHHFKAVTETVADWWLLGEVDLAVMGHFNAGFGESFARTAVQRTARARSVFQVQPCEENWSPMGSRGGCVPPAEERRERCDLAEGYTKMWKRTL